MVAMPTPWKHPKTGVFYFRRAIPDDVRVEIGRREFKTSLRTKDAARAKSLFAIELAKSETVIREARERLAGSAPIELSRGEAERLADVWLAHILEEDEELRIEGLDERAFQEWQETLETVEAGGRASLARGDLNLLEFEVEDFVKSHGLRIETGSPAFRQLSYAFLKAFVKANELALRRQSGQIVDTPPTPSVSELMDREKVSSSDQGESLSIVYGRWKDERRPSPKLTAEWDKSFRRFIELHGDLPVSAITRRHVSSFKDALLKLPARPSGAIRDLPVPEVLRLVDSNPKVARLKPGSIKKDLGAIRAVMTWCVENGYRDDNPATGINVREAKNKGDSRLAYSLVDLKRIFSSPVFSAGDRPRGGAGEAAKWLPILALFSGARVEELGQLLVSDIGQEDGVWFFEVNVKDKGKRVKNRASLRKVPIHRELLACGFLVYVEERRRSGDARLFPDLKPDRNGVITGNWSKWWGRYARNHGIKDRRKVFHSFRHTFKSACRAAGVGKEYHDALTGHRSGDVGDDYGEGYPVAVLAPELARVGYQGLDLSYVHTNDNSGAA